MDGPDLAETFHVARAFFKLMVLCPVSVARAWCEQASYVCYIRKHFLTQGFALCFSEAEGVTKVFS